jgi:surfactin synthase thioesterase subunit
MAAMFRQWLDALPPAVETVAVQLPGRAERLHEPAFQRMDELTARLADVLEPGLKPPFAFFGHSLGARVAYCLAHELRERGLPGPSMLGVAASSPPSLPTAGRRWGSSDDELIDYLRWCGGTPPEVLEDRALLSVVLPVLRADLSVAETWTHRSDRRLSCPIRAFAGDDDPSAPPEVMAGWQQETTASFSLTEIPGGHFFIRENAEPVWDVLAHDLATQEQDAAGGAP